MSDQPDNREYFIERLDSARNGDMEKLHFAVYGRNRPAGFFINKYNTIYTGIEYTGFIAYNADRLAVAYYGVIPCWIQYGNQVILAAQSADTMTHPLHRYKGMFVELSNRCFALCREEGIRIIFGFPNQNSFHGAIHKLGWKMTETMDCFSIPVGGVPLELVFMRYSFFGKIYMRYLRQLLKKYLQPQKGVPNSVINDGYAGVCRDEHYLEYKSYITRQVIQLGHSQVWIRINSGLVIGDMKVTAEDFEAVMRKLIQLAAALGTRRILFQSSPGTFLHGLFSERYQGTPSFPVLFQDLGAGIPLEKIKFTFADIDIF